MNFQPNDLFFTMAELFQQRVSDENKLIICNEGGSRSAKTWDTFHLIVAICDANRGKNLDIYILRDTLVNCRDFTMKEFQDCLKVIGIYNPLDMVQSPKPIYKLFGHKIKFRGLDEKEDAEGYPSDILFFNEALEMKITNMSSLIMRCRKLVVCDWNPKYTDAEIFSWQKRGDCVFTKTTYKNNRHIQPAVKKEIESYNPDVPANIESGTADLFRWKVYGLGERANREGLVFPNVKWIEKFPDEIDQIGYGMDFGETAQTAIVKIAVKRLQPKSELFMEKLFYAPTENSNLIYEILRSINCPPKGKHIWCDSNQPGWIMDLRQRGVMAIATKKFSGSREYWISTIKRYNINIVKDADFRKEQENFCYRVVDGIALSETIKKYDHLWSATGYATVGDFRVEK